MRIINKTIPMDCNIFNISDDHEGNLLRYSDGWVKMVNMVESGYDGIKPENNFVIDHGDIVEAIDMLDKRYDGVTTEAAIYQQMQQATENRIVLARHMIVQIDGNHPRKQFRFFGPNKPGMTETICERLGIPYGGFVCVINYRNSNGDILFKHFASHVGHNTRPSSSVSDPLQREQAIKLGLKRRLSGRIGSCLVMSCGHWHILVYTPPTNQFYIGSNDSGLESCYTQSVHNPGFIPVDDRHYLCCGSFLRSYGENMDGYAERFGYNPVELGFHVMKIRDGKPSGVDTIRL